MPESKVEIHLRTLSDLKALEAARNALEDAVKATKDLTEASADLEFELDRVDKALTKKTEAARRSSQAAKQESDATAQTTKRTQEAAQAEKAHTAQSAALKLELEHVVKALKAEAAAARQAAQSARQAGAAAKSAKDGTIGWHAELKKTGKTVQGGNIFSRLNRGLDDFLARIPGVGGLTSAFRGATGPIAAVVGGLLAARKALINYTEAEENVTQLDTALANQGRLTDETRQKYADLAKTLENETAVAGATWLGILAKLTKFGADETNIDEMAEATKNLAGILGGGEESLSQAALLVAKVMRGNTGALSEYGITVDTTLSKTEQIRDAFRQIAEAGGGQLEARTKTLTGRWREFKTELGNTFEGIGNFISRTGLLQFALRSIEVALSALNKIFPATVQQVDGLTNKVVPLEGAASGAAGAMDELGDSAESAGDRLKKAGEEIQDKFDKAAAAIRKTRQAQDELLDAEARLKIAQIDQEEATLAARRDLTPVEQAQFAGRRAAVQRDVEARKAENAVAEAEGVLKEVRNAIEEQRKLVEAQKEKIPQAEENFRAAAAAAGFLPETATKRGQEYFKNLRKGDSAQLAKLEKDLAAAETFSPAEQIEFGINPGAIHAEATKLRERIKRLEDLIRAFQGHDFAEMDIRAAQSQMEAALGGEAGLNSQAAEAQRRLEIARRNQQAAAASGAAGATSDATRLQGAARQSAEQLQRQFGSPEQQASLEGRTQAEQQFGAIIGALRAGSGPAASEAFSRFLEQIVSTVQEGQQVQREFINRWNREVVELRRQNALLRNQLSNGRTP